MGDTRRDFMGATGAALAGAALVGASATAVAQGSGSKSKGITENDISLEHASAVLHKALEKCAEMGVKMNVAVVDSGANLKVFARMDGAWRGSIDIAIKKACTSRYFDMDTGAIGELSQPGGPLYNIEHSNGGLITFPGGVPLRNAQGEVIGAVGVSGSTVENDHAVASAGAAALG